jgi:hypothetical protein
MWGRAKNHPRIMKDPKTRRKKSLKRKRRRKSWKILRRSLRRVSAYFS